MEKERKFEIHEYKGKDKKLKGKTWFYIGLDENSSMFFLLTNEKVVDLWEQVVNYVDSKKNLEKLSLARFGLTQKEINKLFKARKKQKVK